MNIKMSALVLVAALSGMSMQAMEKLALATSVGAAVLFGGSQGAPSADAARAARVRVQIPSEGIPAAAEELSPTSRAIAKEERCKQDIDNEAGRKIAQIQADAEKRKAQCDTRINGARSAKIAAERVAAERLAAARHNAMLERLALLIKGADQTKLQAVMDVLEDRVPSTTTTTSAPESSDEKGAPLARSAVSAYSRSSDRSVQLTDR
jgi:hypothetical protein